MSVIFLFTSLVVRGQAIIADNFNVTGNGTGFGLNSGVNTGINPPTTRLTGTAAANLRYIVTSANPTKTNTAFGISGSKLRVTSADDPGRFTLSANGTTPFNFASVLGSTSATPQNPAIYDISISMANNSTGVQRFSFALAVVEGDATTWDFGIQLFRTATSDNFYTIGKRIDIAASGLAADLNIFMTNTVPGTFGSELTFLIRVTDAGAETTTFNSRVQVSMDGGLNWFYDTASDPDLSKGFRFDGAGRYFLWDIAPNAGNVTYDNFSVTPVASSATLISPLDDAQNIGASTTLKVAVTNTIPTNMTVIFFGHQVGNPYPGPDFCMAILPDTQNYTDHDTLHGRWYAQTEWIITNRVYENIVYVGGLGDIVQNGDILSGSPNDAEWEVATNAMYRLENPARTLLRYGIPYGSSVGNHDQEPNGDEDGTTTHFNQFFGMAHFSGKPYYGGHYSTNNDSFFNLFSASGLDFIVFSYEFGRYGSGVLDWTENVLATNQNRRIIVMTHYAGSDCGGTSCSMSPGGQAIYDRLKTYPNFFLMMGGHVFNGAGDGEGSRTDTLNGNKVHTLVSDYQGRVNGGNSLMRLLYFSPSNNTVNIKTYAPYEGTNETDANSQFSFTYNMQLPSGPGTPGTSYAPIGTNGNVAPGTETTFVWSGLQANKTYEWYAKVTDSAGNVLISPARQFRTALNTAPVSSNQTVNVTGDQPAQVTLHASDLNGDVLTFQTNNSPLHGLVSNFDRTNGTLIYSPARGYRGSDIFTFHANDSFADSSISTVNFNIFSPPDANTNGIPDAWENQYGISDPNGDPDGDGQNNLAEYFANTNPTNAASVFKVTDAKFETNGTFRLNWSSVGGTRYRVQYSTNDVAGSYIDLVRPISSEMDPSPYGSPSTQSFLDSLSLTNRVRFYRVKAVP